MKIGVIGLIMMACTAPLLHNPPPREVMTEEWLFVYPGAPCPMAELVILRRCKEHTFSRRFEMSSLAGFAE